MADTWELINHPLTDETGLVLAAQMKRQNDIWQALLLVLPVRNSWMQHSAVCWMAKYHRNLLELVAAVCR